MQLRLFFSLLKEKGFCYSYILSFSGKPKHLVNDYSKLLKHRLHSFPYVCIDILFLAWAQIYFLDAASFIFPSAFFILFAWHLPSTLDPLFKLLFQQQKRGSTSKKPNPPCWTPNDFCSVRWEHPISCRTCQCQWVSGQHPKGYELLLLCGFSFVIGCEMGPDIVSAVTL